MAEDSGIAWTDHTYNPWRGCQKISPACDDCYAEDLCRFRKLAEWGPHAPRVRAKAATLNKPRKWHREAEANETRYRVFCASLADVLDNHRSIETRWRADLYEMIEECWRLDWLLLTKRPQNADNLFRPDWTRKVPGNVWMGATAEDQEWYDRRKAHLLDIPARVRFLSMEPLFGRVDLGDLNGIHWIIVGGFCGSEWQSKAIDADDARYIRDQCAEQGVAFFFKQWSGGNQQAIKRKGRLLDGVLHDAFPTMEGK